MRWRWWLAVLAVLGSVLAVHGPPEAAEAHEVPATPTCVTGTLSEDGTLCVVTTQADVSCEVGSLNVAQCESSSAAIEGCTSPAVLRGGWCETTTTTTVPADASCEVGSLNVAQCESSSAAIEGCTSPAVLRGGWCETTTTTTVPADVSCEVGSLNVAQCESSSAAIEGCTSPAVLRGGWCETTTTTTVPADASCEVGSLNVAQCESSSLADVSCAAGTLSDGRCVTTSQATRDCPAGYVYASLVNTCQQAFTGTLVCPSTHPILNSSNRCISANQGDISTRTPTVSCPSGFWTGSGLTCVRYRSPTYSCSVGTLQGDNTCRTSSPATLSCTTGVLVGNRCLTVTSPVYSCTSGTLSGTSCVISSVSRSIPDLSCTTGVLVGNRCLTVTSPVYSCVSGTLSGTSCVISSVSRSIPDLSCTTGVLVGNRCLTVTSPVYSCVSGTLSGTSCVISSVSRSIPDLSCTTGVLVGNRCLTVTSPVYSCVSGTLSGTSCVTSSAPIYECPAEHTLNGRTCEHDIPPDPFGTLGTSYSGAAGTVFAVVFSPTGAASAAGAGCSLTAPGDPGDTSYTLEVTSATAGEVTCTVRVGTASRVVTVTFTGINGLAASGAATAGTPYEDPFSVWGAAATVTGAGCSLSQGSQSGNALAYTLTVTRGDLGTRSCTVTGGGQSQGVVVTFTGLTRLDAAGSVAAGRLYVDPFRVVGAPASVSGAGCSLLGSPTHRIYVLIVKRTKPGLRVCEVTGGGATLEVVVTFTGISGLASTGGVVAGQTYSDPFRVWGAAPVTSSSGCSVSASGSDGSEFTLSVSGGHLVDGVGTVVCAVGGGGVSRSVSVTFTGVSGVGAVGSVAAGATYHDAFRVIAATEQAAASAAVSGEGCAVRLLSGSGTSRLYYLDVDRVDAGLRVCTVSGGGTAAVATVTFEGISGLGAVGSAGAHEFYSDVFEVWGPAASVTGGGCLLSGPVALASGAAGYTLTVRDDGSGEVVCDVAGGGETQRVTVTFTGSAGCVVSLGSSGSRSGSWSASGGCVSSHRGNAQTPYYARFYKFTLAAGARVEIALSSSEDAYLALLAGHGSSGAVLHSNDDADEETSDSRLSVDLAAGSYTIEATTYEARTEGGFALVVDLGAGPGIDGLKESYDATVGEAFGFSFRYWPAQAKPAVRSVSQDGTVLDSQDRVSLDVESSGGTASVSGSATRAGDYVVTFGQPGRTGTDSTTINADCPQYHTEQRDGSCKAPEEVTVAHLGAPYRATVDVLFSGGFTYEPGTAQVSAVSVEPDGLELTHFAIPGSTLVPGAGGFAGTADKAGIYMVTVVFTQPGRIDFHRFPVVASCPDGLTLQLDRSCDLEVTVDSLEGSYEATVDVLFSDGFTYKPAGARVELVSVEPAGLRLKFTGGSGSAGFAGYPRLAGTYDAELEFTLLGRSDTHDFKVVASCPEGELQQGDNSCAVAVCMARLGSGAVTSGTLGPQSGSWVDSCVLAPGRRSDDRIYYANHYTFRLNVPAVVTIDLTSTTDTYLFLLSGHNPFGTPLGSDDDSGNANNSRLASLNLAAGNYTIAASTDQPQTTGNFRLTLTATANCPANQQLVDDTCIEPLTALDRPPDEYILMHPESGLANCTLLQDGVARRILVAHLPAACRGAQLRRGGRWGRGLRDSPNVRSDVGARDGRGA